MGESVVVAGVPELELAAGTTQRYAQYIGGSGTSTLTFCYTVQPGDESLALDYAGSNALILNGGSIVDGAGNPVVPVLPAPGSNGSLSTYEVLLIDTAAPVVSDIACVGPVTTNSDSLQWGVTFDKPVYGVSAADFALAGAGVTGTIASLTGGGTSYIVTVSDVCGTGTLGLNLVDDDSIVNEAGNPLGGPGAGNGNFTGQAFNVVVSLPWSTTGTNFTATEGQASISGVVAAFTDSRGIYSAGDYTAQVYWGDGGASSGTVAYNSQTQQFEVSGSYTYAYAGNWAIQVLISDPTGLMAVSNGSAAIADAPLTASGISSLTGTEGAAFSGTVAGFVDPVPMPSPADYYATVAWGDGQTTVGTVSFNTTTQQYQVAGSHVYAEFGSYSIDVTIDDPGGASIDAASSIAVADAPLVASGQYVTFTPGTAFSGPVATFQDLGGSANAGEFAATITWTTGQGATITTGTVAYDATAQRFVVGGSFLFTADVDNSISVAISDDGGSTATATTTPTTLSLSVGQIAPMEDVPFSGAVANFTDMDPATVDAYSAAVYWGDGTSSTVTSTASAAGQIVADANGGFDVLGAHTYLATASAATLRVVLSGTGRTSVDASRSDIGVTVPPLSGGELTPPPAIEGTWFRNVLLYHFTDSDPSAVAADYNAIIYWGDYTFSTVTSTSNANSIGQIRADAGGGFDVYGSHRYGIGFTGATFSVLVRDVRGELAPRATRTSVWPTRR